MGLSVSDLSCSRAGHPVLHHVNFSVADGVTLLVRGPNGAGKSTLLRVLAGLLPGSGQVVLDETPLNADRCTELVAYSGHLDAIKLQLTVTENLAFWADLFNGATGSALDAFDLAPISDRPVHLCSAGQKRRLGLARLLLARRRLWLLDEPTVSLDAEAVALFAGAVRRHTGDGGVAVIATHAPLDVGPTETLFLEPLAPAVAAESDPFLSGAWA